MKHNIKRIRLLVGSIVFAVLVLSIVFGLGLGTFSAFGPADIALLCPLGALESLLAAKTIMPLPLISLAVAIAVCVLAGKAFCSWVCPASFIREALQNRQHKKSSRKSFRDKERAEKQTNDCAESVLSGCPSCKSADQKRGAKCLPFDSRHVVLLGALASATIFGFPVFCLVCPIGLLLGTVVLLCQFFSGIGDVSIALIAFPAVLVIELVVCRSWCSKFCPLGALISLLSLPNKTLRPHVDTSKCLAASGKPCNKCSQECLENLDPHISIGMNDCSKCGRCSDACPVHAISFMKK